MPQLKQICRSGGFSGRVGGMRHARYMVHEQAHMGTRDKRIDRRMHHPIYTAPLLLQAWAAEPGILSPFSVPASFPGNDTFLTATEAGI
jgi:hypothetical protein